MRCGLVLLQSDKPSAGIVALRTRSFGIRLSALGFHLIFREFRNGSVDNCLEDAALDPYEGRPHPQLRQQRIARRHVQPNQYGLDSSYC